MITKIELLVDSENPHELAESINFLFNIKRARYTVYESNGKVRDKMKDYCLNCEPTEG